MLRFSRDTVWLNLIVLGGGKGLSFSARPVVWCVLDVSCVLLHRHSLQVRSLAHDVSFRLPVDAFKGAHESTHHGGALGTYAGICMGDPEVGDVTISEMSPEDIRAELKRYVSRCAPVLLFALN